MKRDFITFAVFFVLSVILIQLIILTSLFGFHQNNYLAKGEATGGSFSFCLNFAPEINLSNCPVIFNQSTTIEDNSISCTLNLSHVRDHQVLVDSIIINSNGLFFNLTQNGNLFVSGNQSGVRSHSIDIFAYDVHECSFTTDEIYEFTILDINDPPHLREPLPNRILQAGSELVAFNLDAYFDDLDTNPLWGKPLNYTYYASGALNVEILIGNDSVVRIRSPIDFCDSNHVFFEATDQGNLTGDSNVIEIDSRCDDEPTEEGPNTGGVGLDCISEWRCDEWSDCFINGTQYKDCSDTFRCNPNDYMKKFWRECTYVATCFDGIENCHIMPDGSISCEEGIDCGGPCESCSLEKEVDEAEITCFDGIENCHTLPDGSISCEEGVDCGGPCEPCQRKETPGLFIDETANNIILVTAILVVLGIALLAAFIVFRKEIMTFFAKIGWWLTKKKRKQFLLNEVDKTNLLKEVNKLYDGIIKSNTDFTRKDKELIKSIEIIRKYLSLALNIPLEFNFEEVKRGVSKKVYSASLSQGLTLFAQSLFMLENKSIQISKQELLNLVQETRMLIMNTSKLVKEDFNFKALELDLPKPVFIKSQVLIHNSFLALSFSEAISAQNNYFELLALYDKMSEVEKTKIYDELAKIYLYTKSVLSWL